MGSKIELTASDTYLLSGQAAKRDGEPRGAGLREARIRSQRGLFSPGSWLKPDASR